MNKEVFFIISDSLEEKLETPFILFLFTNNKLPFLLYSQKYSKNLSKYPPTSLAA